MLLFLWTNTVRPYLDILDDWITSGILKDRYAETCVKMCVLHKKRMCLVFYICLFLDTSVDGITCSHRLWSDKVEIRTAKADNSKLVPIFLAPVIDQVSKRLNTGMYFRLLFDWFVSQRFCWLENQWK